MNNDERFYPPKGKADDINAADGPLYVNLQTVAVGVYSAAHKKVYVQPWSDRGRRAADPTSIFMVRGAHYNAHAGFGGPLAPFRATQEAPKPLPNGGKPNPAIPNDGLAPAARPRPATPPAAVAGVAPAGGTPPALTEGGSTPPADDQGADGDEGGEDGPSEGSGETAATASVARKSAVKPKPGPGPGLKTK